MIEDDVHRVFQNDQEFAEQLNVYYDGKDYGPLPVVLIRHSERERKILAQDHGMGVYEVTVTCYIAFSHIGVLPEQDQPIFIGDEEFRIVESSCPLGQIILKLRRYDE